MILSRTPARYSPNYDQTIGNPVKLEGKHDMDVAIEFDETWLDGGGKLFDYPAISADLLSILRILLPAQIDLLYDCRDSYDYYSFGEIADLNGLNPILYEVRL